MFPENIAEREKYILQLFQDGNFDARVVDLNLNVNDRNLRLQVMSDALKMEGVRINVSATLAQNIADLMDASLPTPMIADLMYASRERKADPRPQPISNTVAAMIKHSEAVEKQVGTGGGLAGTVGKHWVLDKKLENTVNGACNYGWHFCGPNFQGISGSPAVSAHAGQGTRVIQPSATVHDRFHTDYSQICQLVLQQCWVDGEEKRFSDLIMDPILAPLVSHQGALKINRQPGVEPIVGKYVMLQVVVTP